MEEPERTAVPILMRKKEVDTRSLHLSPIHHGPERAVTSVRTAEPILEHTGVHACAGAGACACAYTFTRSITCSTCAQDCPKSAQDTP